MAKDEMRSSPMVRHRHSPPAPLGRVFVTFRLLALTSLLFNRGSLASEAGQGDGAAGNVHSTVVTLTDNDFDDHLSDAANGLWLIKFYAPWCGHCKKLAPTLDKVAPFIKGKMAIGKVDCTKHDATCKRFEVRGYPTLKFYRDGEFHDYPGGRDADSIIEFAEKMSAPSVKMVKSKEEALVDVAGKDKEGIAFLMYDPQAKDSDDVEELLLSTTYLQVFRQVGRKLQAHASFAVLAASNVAEVEKFGAGSKEPFLIKIEKDVDPIKYEGEMTSPLVSNFVKSQNVALVTKLGPHNFRTTGNLGKPLAIAVVDYDDAKSEKLLSDVTKYAKNGPYDIRQKFLYAHMDGKKWTSFLKQFEIDTSSLPQFFVLDVPTRKYWRDAEATFGVDSVEDFLFAVTSGTIEGKVQSNPNLSASEKFQIAFIKWLPWSVFAMMIFFAGVLYVLLIIFLPDDEEEEVNKKPSPESIKSQKEKGDSDEKATPENNESKKDK